MYRSLDAMESSRLATLESARRNSLRYLSWDYLDVYVATSMREKWEFEATHDFLRDVVENHLRDITMQSLRWFDPTQCILDYPSDKGLLESLMLKRADCTLYMAQEADTLGKDSELAATLAQGKPVIAYVPRIEAEDLVIYEDRLRARPLEFIRKRLFSLLADGFFDKEDILRKIVTLLDGRIEMDPKEVTSKVVELLTVVRRFYEEIRQFSVIEPEIEGSFREDNENILSEGYSLLAAVEKLAFDLRADTIQKYHPLNMQVHLGSGVSNGVLVVRTAAQCAAVLENFLLQDVSFRIETETVLGESEPAATVLKESLTDSKFRIVTKHKELTHSFWMFYN